MKKIFLLLTALFLGLSVQLSAEVRFEDVSLDELRAMAVKREKLVFIDVYATWCPPCRQMERDVFSREDVGKFMAERFVSGKYDIDKYIGYKLSQKFKINSIPTYLILDTESQLVGRMQGAMTAEEFMENIRTIIKNSPYLK